MLFLKHFDLWLDANKEKLSLSGFLTIHSGEMLVLVVTGPNKRTDFHVNPSEEILYQHQGDAKIELIESGSKRIVHLPQGSSFIIPPNIPHYPDRSAGSVGIVIERVRSPEEFEEFHWYNGSIPVYVEKIKCGDMSPSQMTETIEKGNRLLSQCLEKTPN